MNQATWPSSSGPDISAMVRRNRAAIIDGVDEILAGGGKRGRIPEYWDGHAAERIAADLAQWLIERQHSS